jgi:hypothetical protein
MTEENGQTEASTETTPVPLVNAEGKFVENWRDSLDEDIRGEESLKSFDESGLKSLAKSFVHVRKMVGADVMKAPNEKSSDAEWAEFHKIGGRPDTAADYNIVRPEEFPEEHWSDSHALEWMELFHKIGISKKQVDAIVQKQNTDLMVAFKAQEQAILDNRQQSRAALNQEWGAAYESKIHLGNIAIERGCEGDEEFRARLTKKFGDDPDFVKYSSNLGSKFAEHGDVAVTRVPSPDDIQTQINDVMKNPAYISGKPGEPEHDALVQKVQRLFQEKIKSTTTGQIS